jgi:glycosyltransferase involved in cell wall biosynthesis
MNRKLISVIIPVYNVRPYLEECIKSVINQTYKDLEIILVDDGSTDGSQDICDYFKSTDSRITVIHQINQGLVGARKSGLEAANGCYICFVDGDDWIEPDMCNVMLQKILEKQSNVVLSGYYRNNEIAYQPEWGEILLTQDSRYIMLGEFFADNNLHHNLWYCLFEKELICASYGKVPINMQYGEDAVCFLYCLLAAKKMYWIKEAYYHYRIRTESMTQRRSICDVFNVWIYCANILKKANIISSDKIVDGWLESKFLEFLVCQCSRGTKHYQISDISRLYGKKIVIYGAGKVGTDYWKQMSSYSDCHIVAWVDKNYDEIKCSYREIQSVETVENIGFDYIIVAVAREEVYQQIREELLQNGIIDEKIVWLPPQVSYEVDLTNTTS